MAGVDGLDVVARPCGPRSGGSSSRLSSARTPPPGRGSVVRSIATAATIGSAGAGSRPHAARNRGPPRRASSSCEIDDLAHGGRGRRAPQRLRRLRRRRPSRRPRARAGDQAEARLRRGAAGRAARRRAPTAIPDRCTHGGEPCPGAPWQALAVRAPARGQAARRSTRPCAGSAASTASSSSRSSRRSSGGATATSSSTPSASARASSCSASTAAAAGTEIVDAEDCLLASERAERRPQAGPRVGARGGLPALRPPHAAGLLRNLVVREGRRTGQIQTRLVTSPGSSRGRPSTCTR